MSSPEKRPIAGLPRNVFWLGLVSFFNDLGSEMIFPVLPIFLREGLGASMPAIGLIDGIAESSSALIKILSGSLSDRLRRRRPIVFAGYTISNVAQPVIGLAQTWLVVVPLRFFDRLGKGIRDAPRDAIIADSVDEKTRGWAYGFHRAMDSAGGVLGPLIAFCIIAGFSLSRGQSIGQLLTVAKGLVSDYRWVILAAAVPNLIAIGLIFFVREKPRDTVTEGRLRLALPRGPFRVLVAAATVFGLGNLSYSFIVLRASQIGVPAPGLPLLYLLFHLGQMVFAGPVGALSDRIGRKWVVGAGYGAFALMCGGWVFASSVLAAAALSLLYGFSLACTESALRAYGVDLVPADRRGASLGALNGLAGLAALPASLVAGVLWSAYGAWAAFTWGGGLALLATIGLTLVREPTFSPSGP